MRPTRPEDISRILTVFSVGAFPFDAGFRLTDISVCVSAVTVTGLNTVALSRMTTWQQIILFVNKVIASASQENNTDV
jgi:hypothetical protein